MEKQEESKSLPISKVPAIVHNTTLIFQNAELITECEDEVISDLGLKPQNISSPMYPNVPHSQYSYFCSWMIQVPDKMACLIEIQDFQGPDWLDAIIRIPSYIYQGQTGFVKRFEISSEYAPNSITIGQYSILYFDIREEQIQPKRGKKHVFLARVSALLSEDDSKYCTS